MAIIDYLTDSFVFMEKHRISDGFGGFVWEWYDGETFQGKAIRKTSSDFLLAAQQGAKEVYKLVAPENVILEKNDTVKRVKDGAILRITSDSIDGSPPASSEIKCVMVYAERTTL